MERSDPLFISIETVNRRTHSESITINRKGRPPKVSVKTFSMPPKSIIISKLVERKLVKPVAHQTELIGQSDYTSDDPLNGRTVEDFDKETAAAKSREYICDFPECKYSCKFASNVLKHKRTHNSEKPYACEECVFQTKFVNSLKVHKRLHTGEKPYICECCTYRCNSITNLKKHWYHIHSDKKVKKKLNICGRDKTPETPIKEW